MPLLLCAPCHLTLISLKIHLSNLSLVLILCSLIPQHTPVFHSSLDYRHIWVSTYILPSHHLSYPDPSLLTVCPNSMVLIECHTFPITRCLPFPLSNCWQISKLSTFPSYRIIPIVHILIFLHLILQLWSTKTWWRPKTSSTRELSSPSFFSLMAYWVLLMVWTIGLVMIRDTLSLWVCNAPLLAPGPWTVTKNNFKDCWLAPQITTNFFDILRPCSDASWKTSLEVTYPMITPQQARLTLKFLKVGSRKKKVHLWQYK